jgi:serine O-acetyltransferase
MAADLEHMAGLWGVRHPRRAITALSKVLLYPRVRAVLWFRLSHSLWRRRPLRPLALLIQAHVIKIAGAEIHPAAHIGPGLNLDHSVGVVIGHQVVAGRNLSLYQGVTLGHGPRPGQPRLGDGVRVFAGASVLGGVEVGDGARIGAGAVVIEDVAAGEVTLGRGRKG